MVKHTGGVKGADRVQQRHAAATKRQGPAAAFAAERKICRQCGMAVLGKDRRSQLTGMSDRVVNAAIG
jgi:hypothetical protein